MQQIEFTVDNTALATVKDVVINANFEEVETALTEMVAPYATMIVTEDAIADAKSDRAKLRKIRTSIDDYRKSIEKAYKEPVEVFKRRVKPLLEICDSGIENLDNQVKAFENAQKQAKIDGLHAYFDANAGEAAEFISFQQIANPKWENSGFSVEDAQKEIDAAITKTTDSVSLIRAIGNEFVPSLLQEYARCHDLAAVLRMNQDLIARKEAEEKRREAESLRRAAAEAEKSNNRTEIKILGVDFSPEIRDAKAKPQEVARPTAEVSESFNGISHEIEVSGSVMPVDFRVYATREQLNALKAFLNANGIKYGRVPT